MYEIKINDKLVLTDIVEFASGKKYFFVARKDGTAIPPIPRSTIDVVERRYQHKESDWVEVRLKKFD